MAQLSECWLLSTIKLIAFWLQLEFIGYSIHEMAFDSMHVGTTFNIITKLGYSMTVNNKTKHCEQLRTEDIKTP